jgi:hypothetical protein
MAEWFVLSSNPGVLKVQYEIWTKNYLIDISRLNIASSFFKF